MNFKMTAYNQYQCYSHFTNPKLNFLPLVYRYVSLEFVCLFVCLPDSRPITSLLTKHHAVMT